LLLWEILGIVAGLVTMDSSGHEAMPSGNALRRKNMRKNDRANESTGSDHGGKVRDIAFLLIGIGIGSGVALLLAPSSGEEVRHAIGLGYRKTVKTIGRRTEDLRDRAEDFLQHAHDLREAGSRLLHIGRGVEAVRRTA
jgi:gas vesicle protein